MPSDRPLQRGKSHTSGRLWMSALLRLAPERHVQGSVPEPQIVHVEPIGSLETAFRSRYRDLCLGQHNLVTDDASSRNVENGWFFRPCTTIRNGTVSLLSSRSIKNSWL